MANFNVKPTEVMKSSSKTKRRKLSKPLKRMPSCAAKTFHSLKPTNNTYKNGTKPKMIKIISVGLSNSQPVRGFRINCFPEK